MKYLKPQQNPCILNKVAANKRLAESNCRNKELVQETKAWDSKPKLTSNQAYSIWAVLAAGVLDLLDYYILLKQ